MMVARRTRGAGVHKPTKDETAGGVTKLRVRRYGDLDAGRLNTENVRMAIENTAIFSDFQAEYEDSIPFTRSGHFVDLARALDFILTNRRSGAHFPIDCSACLLIRCRVLRAGSDRLRCELIKAEYPGLEKRS